MTTIYFVRHAEPDSTVREGRIRPLTPKGLADAEKLRMLFAKINVDKIYSSPFKRSYDTVLPIAKLKNLPIETIEDFRERLSDSVQTISMDELIKRQWLDFSYTLSDGETYEQVVERNLKELYKIFKKDVDMSIVIETHGVAMSTMINRFFKLDLVQLERILRIYPYIAKLEFDGSEFISFNEIEMIFD